jgi:endonuclease/exonuclease/phosphatase family metal-dependent hydrolase
MPRAVGAEGGMEFKLITWNLLNGDDGGKNDWPRRKLAMKAALAREKPAIFCTQEALTDQLTFLDATLKGFARSGVGRDDGKEKGEYCAIYFDSGRFKKLGDGTFWLSDTPDTPGKGFDPAYPRICSWVRLQDVKTERTFVVFNTHFPLNPKGRDKGARLIVDKISEISGKDSVILCGDFNCGPESDPWKCFADSKLSHCAALAKRNIQQQTFHKFGFGLMCLDGVLVSAGWTVSEDRVLNQAEEKVYPSDHFGVAVTVTAK